MTYFDKLLKPECPKYPDVSVYLGKMASWLLDFARWTGIPLGALRKPLMFMIRRQWRVEWARTSIEERMTTLTMSAMCVGGVLALYAMRASPSAHPAGSIRG